MPQDPPKLPLTDQLAVERTSLAAERTLLAYARTALGLVATGTVLIRLSPGNVIDATLGGIGIFAGVVIAGIGTIRIATLRRRLRGAA